MRGRGGIATCTKSSLAQQHSFLLRRSLRHRRCSCREYLFHQRLCNMEILWLILAPHQCLSSSTIAVVFTFFRTFQLQIRQPIRKANLKFSFSQSYSRNRECKQVALDRRRRLEVFTSRTERNHLHKYFIKSHSRCLALCAFLISISSRYWSAASLASPSALFPLRARKFVTIISYWGCWRKSKYFLLALANATEIERDDCETFLRDSPVTQIRVEFLSVIIQRVWWLLRKPKSVWLMSTTTISSLIATSFIGNSESLRTITEISFFISETWSRKKLIIQITENDNSCIATQQLRCLSCGKNETSSMSWIFQAIFSFFSRTFNQLWSLKKYFPFAQ